MSEYSEIDYMLDLIYRDIQLYDDISDEEMKDRQKTWGKYVKEASSLSLREPNDCCGVCTTRKMTNEVFMRIVEMNDELNFPQEHRLYEKRACELFLNSLKTRCLKLDCEL